MASLFNRIGLAALLASSAGAAALWHSAASAGQPRAPAAGDEALQVLADVVLIEAECRQFSVDYGKLFAFAERNGIRPVEILPLGERRAAFDAAYRRRAREGLGARLCGALAEDRDTAIPGVFTLR